MDFAQRVRMTIFAQRIDFGLTPCINSIVFLIPVSYVYQKPVATEIYIQTLSYMCVTLVWLHKRLPTVTNLLPILTSVKDIQLLQKILITFIRCTT